MQSNEFSEEYNIIQEKTSEIICFIQQGEKRFTSEILIEIAMRHIEESNMSETEKQYLRNDLRWIEKRVCRKLQDITE